MFAFNYERGSVMQMNRQSRRVLQGLHKNSAIWGASTSIQARPIMYGLAGAYMGVLLIRILVGV